jgi:hypothetical protein
VSEGAAELGFYGLGSISGSRGVTEEGRHQRWRQSGGAASVMEVERRGGTDDGGRVVGQHQRWLLFLARIEWGSIQSLSRAGVEEEYNSIIDCHLRQRKLL